METKGEFFGNFLLVSGNGRNVGKTFFACHIIAFLSQMHPVNAGSIENVFQYLKPLLTEGPVICESAGLGGIIDAGLSFFLNKPGKPIAKNQIQARNSQIIENDDQTMGFKIEKIEFENNQFFIKR